MIRALLLTCLIVMAWPLKAAPTQHVFPNIDGGVLNLSDWHGRPILVVNTASGCGFTGQYEGLQTLYDRYKEKGLVVLAVPSDDFQQELSSADEVKHFCEIAFGLDLPMADISNVTGPEAHPFYKDVARQTGFTPTWNFNKILIGRDGSIVETWGAVTRPLSKPVVSAIIAQLARN